MGKALQDMAESELVLSFFSEYLYIECKINKEWHNLKEDTFSILRRDGHLIGIHNFALIFLRLMCYSGQEENDGIGSLGYATLKEVES